MEGLPQPSSSARTVVAVTGAICDALIPALGPLRELFNLYLARKMEEYRQVLIDEIEARGVTALEDLTEGQIEFIIPASYRFFEQVRLGDYEHNLRVLARYLAGRLAATEPIRESGDVGRFARQLEYLDLKTLKVMANALLLRDKLDADDTSDFVSGEGLKHHFPEQFQDTSLSSVRSSLAVLSSRGLLGPDGVPQLGKTEETYFVTPDGYALSKLLLQQRATQYDD